MGTGPMGSKDLLLHGDRTHGQSELLLLAWGQDPWAGGAAAATAAAVNMGGE